MWPTPGATLRSLGLSSGDTLAEVGSGNGYLALPTARVTAPARTYGLDLDESLLGELERLADRQGIDNVVAVHCDARNPTSALDADIVTDAAPFALADRHELPPYHDGVVFERERV
ncbi:methyltransferase domain-containing protein [Halosimplex litoreum]|uniref:methyltransferase domain-containing protein n=1 Tax=Halosimplex litoreum TaxID=1198301 RepID=UPI001E5067ED|nr:methyltransferase domain-containing protein [Halosimplex litoreum]